ncbi:MAG: hypothetical protein PHX13_11275, partial [Thiovulaceae bacterium]|nr:hypothetical protein [Sulfurimonadaceae bacterium]
CFAKDINTTLSLMNNQNLSWGTSQARVKFFDDLNTTSRFLTQTNNSATFSTSEGNFTSGNAILNFKVNFDRNTSTPDNPFNIAKNDFNITSIMDTSNTSGNDFNRSSDMSATFVYGRTHAPRYRFTGNNGNASIYYEMYCGSDGNKTLLPSNVIGDSDSVGWYLNKNHISSDGTITVVDENNSAHVVTTSSILPLSIVTGSGYSTATLNYNSSKGFPYKTTIQDKPSSWLIYDPYNPSATVNDFEVEFYGGANNWTGKQTNHTTTDSIAAPVTRKRILW